MKELQQILSEIPSSLPDSGKVWELIVKTLDEDLESIPYFYEKLQILANKDEKFISLSQKYLEGKIAKITDNSLDSEEKLKLAKEFIFIFQFLDLSTQEKIIAQLIFLSEREIEISKNLPNQVITLLDFVDFSSLSIEIFTKIYDNMTKSKSVSSIIIAACFLSDIFSVVPQSFDEIPSLIQELSDRDDEIQQITSAFLAERCMESNVLPPEIYEPLVPLLTSKNLKVCQRAHKTMRQLVKSMILEVDMILPVALEQFAEYDSTNVKYFFKLINAIVDSQETFSTTYSDLVLHYLLKMTEKQDTTDDFRADLLDLFCTIAARSGGNAIEQVIPVASTIAIDLMKKRKHISVISSYVLAVFKCIPRDIEVCVKAFIPHLVDAIRSQTELSLKEKLNTIENLSVVLKENMDKIDANQVLPVLCDILMSSFSLVHDSNIFYLCSPLLELSQIVHDKVLNAFFIALNELLMKETKCNQTNAILSTMAKFMKKGRIDAKHVSDVVDEILNCKLPYMHKFKQPIRNEDTQIYHFLRKACKHYTKDVQPQVLPFFTACVEESRLFVLPSVLDIVKGFVMDDVTSKTVFDTVLKKFSTLKRNDEESLCSCMETLNIVLEKNPSAFNAEEAIKLICSFIFSESEEEEDILEESYASAAMVRLCFGIYASSSVSIVVDKTLFNDLLSLLPLDPTLEDAMLPIYDSLSDIATKQDYAFALPIIAQIIVEPLVLKNEERIELGVNGPLYDKMRNAMKIAIKCKKGFEKELTKGWPRAKINKLNAVLK